MSKYFLVLSIFLLGCESDDRIFQEIISKNTFRRDNNLVVVDSSLVKDSSATFIREEFGSYPFYNKVAKPDKDSIYYLATYYSGINFRDFQKIVYTKHNGNSIKLAEETDIYRKLVNDSIYAELIFKYDYEQNRKALRIDSIPTNNLVNKRKKDLDSMANWAKNNGWEICGTAANEILDGNLPKTHTILDSNKVDYYILRFK